MYSKRCISNSPANTPKRLLVYAASPSLRTALDHWARLNGVEIVYAEKNKPDFYCTSGIAMIVDRNYMMEDVWQAYVEFVREVDGVKLEVEGKIVTSTIDELVLILDDRNDLPLPPLKSGRCIQITDSRNRIPRIISALDTALIRPDIRPEIRRHNTPLK